MLTKTAVTQTEKQFRMVMPVLMVDDVRKTAEYYHNVFGFAIDFMWHDPATFASLSRDSIAINFKQSDPPGNGLSNKSGNGIDVYFCVNDLDQLFEEMKAKKVKIIMEPTNQIYGMRDMIVEDCNGYVLCFGEELIL